MTRRLITVVRGYARLCPGLVTATLVAAVAAALVEGIGVAAFWPLLHALLDSGASTPVVGGRWLQGWLSLLQRMPVADPVLAAVALIVLVMAIKAVVVFLREWLMARASGHVQETVKQRVLDHYAHAPYPFFLGVQHSDLLYRCTVAPHKAALLMLRAPQVVAEGLNVIVVMGVLAVLWPAAAGALAVCMVGYQALTRALARRVSYLTGRGRRDADAEQVAACHELFTGIRQIAVCQTKAHWLTRFRQASHRYTQLMVRDAVWLALPRHGMELMVVGLLVAAVVALRARGSAIAPAQKSFLGVVMLAALRLVPSVATIGRHWMEMHGYLADAEQLQAVLDAPAWPTVGGSRICQGLTRDMVLERVSFAHPGRPPLLQELTLTLRAGQCTAIVGTSGAGKSTLLNLLLGLLQPTTGRILIDGVPLTEHVPGSWLAHVGVVTQDSFMLHATVVDNIVFGRADVSRAAVEAAARMAGAAAFIEALPQGYETVIGERGMKLSGGQQQRLAIARAMLTHPGVLFFDEATSQLDAESERQVQSAIEQVSGGRTVVMVTHRWTAAQRADRVIVMEHGRIVEDGTPEAVQSLRGAAARLTAAGAAHG